MPSQDTVPHEQGTADDLSPELPVKGGLVGAKMLDNAALGWRGPVADHWLLPKAGLTWGLSGAGLKVTGLFAHRLHQGVTAPDDVLALVALHIPHPHADATGFCALGKREKG